MIELFEFQRSASEGIVDRFVSYFDDPILVGTKSNLRRIPFLQALASITASGKTAILADAVATVAETLPVPPVILWLSKGRVVVEQSFANLVPGGKYHHLLGNFPVKTLAEYDADEVSEEDRPLVFFATVGTFNVRDKELGNRLIYRCEIDNAARSTWDALKDRLDRKGRRKPLLVVYDEAHNLTDQQADLLLELEPDGFLLASATMRLPARIGADVDELKRYGKSDDWLVTQVDSKAVAESGLVKSTLLLGGYRAPMEETVSSLLADMAEANEDAREYGLEGRPKAIYVCNTNIVEGNAYQRDDPRQPFHQRQAPPILIWRYLTENHQVPPSKIAVYCSLAFNREFPPPPEFIHFKGGDSDYDTFVQGDYRHIIFNLSLQEGWDDPLCYFAYIDKSMESRVQVEQIIGRLLRQPNARSYPAERLNTAHFYVRVDKSDVFNELLTEVQRKLKTDAPGVRIISAPPGKPRPQEYRTKRLIHVPTTAYNPQLAVQPIAKLTAGLSDYRDGSDANTRAEGSRRIVRHQLGDVAVSTSEWEAFTQANLVSARWVFQREVKRRFQGALQVASTSDPKFDALIGVGSRAYDHIVQVADQVVRAYLENVYLVQKRVDPYVAGPILGRPDQVTPFKNALHEGYDGLNPLELSFAEALDETGLTWCRNPSQTGYGIPLITVGTTKVFYPDFLVWKDERIIAVDTKGGHLLPDAAARKLFRIEPPKGVKKRLVVRFVSEGRWSPAPIEQQDRDGYTLWGLKQDGTRRATYSSDLHDTIESLLAGAET